MAMCRLMTRVRHRLMWSSSSITVLRRSTIVYRCLRLLLLLLLWRLPVKVRDAIRIGRGALRLIVMTLVVIWMAIISSSRLRYVWNDLHTTGDNTSWSATTSRIRRCGRSTKALRQLLYKCLAHVIGSNVNSISNSEHNEGPLRRERQT